MFRAIFMYFRFMFIMSLIIFGGMIAAPFALHALQDGIARSPSGIAEAKKEREFNWGLGNETEETRLKKQLAAQAAEKAVDDALKEREIREYNERQNEMMNRPDDESSDEPAKQ